MSVRTAPFGVSKYNECVTQQPCQSSARTLAASGVVADGLCWRTIRVRRRCGRTKLWPQASRQRPNDKNSPQLSYHLKNVRKRSEICQSTTCCTHTCIYVIDTRTLRSHEYFLGVRRNNGGAFAVLQEDQELMKRAWKPTLTVAVSGAAGQIAQHLLFMVKMLSTLYSVSLVRICIVQQSQQLRPCQCPCS